MIWNKHPEALTRPWYFIDSYSDYKSMKLRVLDAKIQECRRKSRVAILKASHLFLDIF